MKRQGVDEAALETALTEPGSSDRLSARDRAALRFVGAIEARPGQPLESELSELRRHLSEPEVAELLGCLVINLGMHVVLGSFDFYPLLDPDGRLITESESRALYGPTPALRT